MEPLEHGSGELSEKIMGMLSGLFDDAQSAEEDGQELPPVDEGEPFDPAGREAEEIYTEACSLMRADGYENLVQARKRFAAVSGYQYADDLEEKCGSLITMLREKADYGDLFETLYGLEKTFSEMLIDLSEADEA